MYCYYGVIKYNEQMSHSTRIIEYNPNPIDELHVLDDPYQGLTSEEIEANKLILQRLEEMPQSLSWEFITEEKTTDA